MNPDVIVNKAFGSDNSIVDSGCEAICLLDVAESVAGNIKPEAFSRWRSQDGVLNLKRSKWNSGIFNMSVSSLFLYENPRHFEKYQVMFCAMLPA